MTLGSIELKRFPASSFAISAGEYIFDVSVAPSIGPNRPSVPTGNSYVDASDLQLRELRILNQSIIAHCKRSWYRICPVESDVSLKYSGCVLESSAGANIANKNLRLIKGDGKSRGNLLVV